MTLYHFLMRKQRAFKRDRSKNKSFLGKEWGIFQTHNVFKGEIISTRSFAKGDFRLVYRGKLRVLMGCFMRLACKKKRKRR